MEGVEYMTRRTMAVLILCSLGVSAAPLRAVEPAGAASNPAPDRSRDPEVNDWYDHFEQAYRTADWEALKDLHKQWPTMRLQLHPTQRKNVIYMRRSAEEFRPAWWKHTSSTRNKSFKARIWKKWFIANYVPSETMGITHSRLDVGRKRLDVIVSWRPTYIDNPKPFSNDNSFHVFIPEAEDYGFTFGTMAEVIVWHELGHNYITLNLPFKHVYALYRDYGYLFSHLQEFYADLTAMYHATPPGRLFTMKLRLMAMVDYDETNAHTRGAAHGVGALLLAKILNEPEQWPSFHFPGKVPEENVEQMTIFYLYRHVDPAWTLAEDRRLREFINTWTRRKGAAALRHKGLISLPNGLKMNIMAGEDRKLQQQRDQWIRRKLEKIIADARADDPKIFERDRKDIANTVRVAPAGKLRDRDKHDRPDAHRRSKRSSKQKPSRQQAPDDDLDELLGDEEDE